MMTPEIIAMLSKEQQPANIVRLRNDLRGWLRMSRTQMKRKYPTWDYNLRTFRQRRFVEKNDIDAKKQDEPAKMTVPMSYTQVMTYVTFAFMLMKQNDTFFELNTAQNNVYSMEEASEDVLESDLRINNWDAKLVQSLLDVSRFGICAFKTTWKTDKVMVNVPMPGTTQDTGSFNEVTAPTMSAQEIVRYEGNDVISISPYRLLPDMRFPLSRWREGRFVADEYEYNIQYLRDLEETQNLLCGTKYITRTSRDLFIDGRDGHWSGGWDGSRFEIVNAFIGEATTNENDWMCISTEGHFKIVPKDYGLGPENYACDFLVQIINDERIVRLERLEYMHCEFIYDIGQFLPDMHSKLNMSLVDPIAAIQEVITFLINARVISLRQGIERHFIYDPSAIDASAVAARSPAIPMIKGAPRTGIQNFVMQLKYQDPTVMNMQEQDQFQKIMQTVTGVNENAMGQYAPGRRSATENRAANQGAASRMTMHTSLLFSDCYGELGRKMLSNLRQGMSFDQFQKVLGDIPPTPGMTLQDLYAQFAPADRTQLIGNRQFFVFNGTTSSERTYLAQSLQELVVALMSNPQIMPLLGYDITKLVDEIQRLRGIRNVSRFKVTPGPTGIPNPGAAAALAASQPGGAAPPVGGGGAPSPVPVPAAGAAGVPGGL